MQIRQILCILTLISAIPAGAQAQSPGGDPPATPSAAAEVTPPAKPTRSSSKINPKLPDEYKSKDVDKDNQIGMYEWPKTDWAKFRELDLNGDGFLTAKELAAKPKKKGSDKSSRRDAPRSSGSSSSGSMANSSGSSSDGGSSTKSESTGPVTSLGDDELQKKAEEFFATTDKDGNGKISEDEINKSMLVKIKFKKLSKPPAYPLNKQEFIPLFVEAWSASK